MIIEHVLSMDPEFFTNPKGRNQRWVPICRCGHTAASHDEEVGGTRARNSIPWVIRYPACTGPAFRNQQRPNPNYSPDSPDEPQAIYATKCFCEKFEPVAEIDQPGSAFNRTPARDNHAFVSGLRALWVRLKNRKLVETDEELSELVDSKFRWLIDESDRACTGGKKCPDPAAPTLPSYDKYPLGISSVWRCESCRTTDEVSQLQS